MQRRRNNELVPGAGERYIQDAHFFADGLAALRHTHRAVGHSGIQPAVAVRAQVHAQPQRRVEQHRVGGIAQIEPPGCVRQDDHRKFQPLGAVDGHNGNRPLRQHRRAAALHSAAFHRAVHHPQERGQPSRAAPVHTGGPGRKRPQRLPPGGAVFHRAHSREVMRAGEYLAAQLLHGRGGGQPPQRPQRFQKSLCLWLFAFQQRRVQAAARGQQAQTRQIVRRE